MLKAKKSTDTPQAVRVKKCPCGNPLPENGFAVKTTIGGDNIARVYRTCTVCGSVDIQRVSNPEPASGPFCF